MADLRSQLRAHLLTKAAVTALVGSGASARIYADNLPRDVTLPALTIVREADDRLEDLISDTGLGAANLLVKGYATKDVDAESLITTVLAADVANYSGGSWGTAPIDDAILTDRPVGHDDPIDGSDQCRRWAGARLTVWHQI